MITAHQNQMEQLRESFKRKMADAELWQTKLDDAVRNERKKKEQEMQMLETKLKENFIMVSSSSTNLYIIGQRHGNLIILQ